MRSELAKQKLAFLASEESRRQEEHQQNTHKNMFDEWQLILTNLREIRADLLNPLLDEESKSDLRLDLSNIRKRKITLAIALGFDTAA